MHKLNFPYKVITKNKLIVISGCSSGGKSTLLTELSNNGYTVMPEVGRELVKEQLALNSGILPWKEPARFCELLVEKSIDRYHEATKFKSVKDGVIFFDRSFLEGISYFQTLNINKYDYLINDLRYYSTIFMVPPWQEIFCEDAERKNSFKNAVEEYDRLVEHYIKYGYDLVILPRVSVKERYQFVVDNIKGYSSEK
jgi:predicted ATPase